MHYTIQPSHDGRYILLTVEGEFTAKSFMTCIIETHTLGMRLGIHHYLVDATKARNIDSILGNYKFAYTEMPKSDGVDPLAVVAGLISPEDHSHDFVETVSNNAGMPFKLFTDFDTAVAYLNAYGSPLPGSPEIRVHSPHDEASRYEK